MIDNDLAKSSPGCGTSSGTQAEHFSPASPPPPSPKKSRGGAPAGNTNAALHGLRGVGLPSGARRLARSINAFRRSLCEAVEARGPIDLHAAATIDTACAWLRHGLLAARWLRIEHDKLSPADRLAFSREVAKAAAERDKAIRALGIHETDSSDPWAAIDRLRVKQATEAARLRDEAAIAANPTKEAARPADAAAKPLGGLKANKQPADELRLPLIPLI